MNTKRNTGWIAALALSCFACAALAQEGEEAAGDMSSEQAAMMQAWSDAMTPGPEHERLAEAVGEWNATVKWWMEPGAEPSVSESSVTRSMSLDGRVLVEEWQGEMMGQSFVGHGQTGYDNVTEKYWSTWTDNMSTGLMVFHGDYDPETGRYTYTGQYTDPMTGEVIESRSVSHDRADGSQVMVMYETRDGQEIKTMEMTLERREAQ
jgi:hypothetical protein